MTSNLRPTPKPKWQRNNRGGYSLMVWYRGKPVTHNGQVVWMGFEGWQGHADVFKPKKGDMWVVRWLQTGSTTRWRQGTAPTIREAMRLAQFMVGLQDGH